VITRNQEKRRRVPGQERTRFSASLKKGDVYEEGGTHTESLKSRRGDQGEECKPPSRKIKEKFWRAKEGGLNNFMRGGEKKTICKSELLRGGFRISWEGGGKNLN